MGNCFIMRYNGVSTPINPTSLYSLCKSIKKSGYYEYIIERVNYSVKAVVVQQITDENIDSVFNSVDAVTEDEFVLLKANSINITKLVTLPCPKKSLIIMCPTISGTGTISMTGKGPNCKFDPILLVHTGDIAGVDRILIPAYADNALTATCALKTTPVPGNNGTGFNCGSGGVGGVTHNNNSTSTVVHTSGSGYSYGGGASTSGVFIGRGTPTVSPSTPMCPNETPATSMYECCSGVGNPVFEHTWGTYVNYSGHSKSSAQNFGVGGRLIVFCNNITDVKLEAKGVSAIDSTAWGAACAGGSGGGSVNVFYTGTNTAQSDTSGGAGGVRADGASTGNAIGTAGSKGGNGTVVNIKCNKLF